MPTEVPKPEEHTQTTMSNNRGDRLQAYSKIIWGDGDYYFDQETDDFEYYICWVRRGFISGKPLTGTVVCHGPDAAWRELERMLRLLTTCILSGQPITKKKRREIHGGPHGEYKKLLEEMDKCAENYVHSQRT